MKAGQAFEKQGIDVDSALKAVMTSSGGCNAMTRVHEYMTHNRTIDYSFLASFLIKDMNIGLSLIEKKDESDPTYRMFTAIRDLYVEAAKKNGYDTDEVFDAFQFIEK
jgi:3-hydroxyisobutyrate dehydrogenase-like beta-hydroxyacid dehydrogenase